MKLLNFFSGWNRRSNKAASILWGGTTNSSSGVVVNANTALAVSSVYACVRVISETLASLPLILYRRLPDGGKERATDHPAYRLMHDRPNNYQTSFIFRELLQGHLCLRGNAYSQIIRNRGREVVQLVPLPPDQVEPKMVFESKKGNISIEYIYTPLSGEKKVFPQEQILHLQGLGADGVKGLSVIDLAREAIGLTIAEEKHAGSYFGNSASPNGVLEYPGKMSAEAVKVLRESFDRAYAGIGNAHKTIALESGVKFNPVTMTNEQSQFIQSRKFQVSDICRWFRVPPHLVGDLERATFSNIEQQSLEFIMYSMRPWFVRWEQSLNYSILSESDRENYYFEFLADGLLRGDLVSRYNAYAIGRQNGWLSADEIRAIENMNPLPEGKGKDYLSPLNMQSSNQTANKTELEEESEE